MKKQKLIVGVVMELQEDGLAIKAVGNEMLEVLGADVKYIDKRITECAVHIAEQVKQKYMLPEPVEEKKEDETNELIKRLIQIINEN